MAATDIYTITYVANDGRGTNSRAYDLSDLFNAYVKIGWASELAAMLGADASLPLSRAGLTSNLHTLLATRFAVTVTATRQDGTVTPLCCDDCSRVASAYDVLASLRCELSRVRCVACQDAADDDAPVCESCEEPVTADEVALSLADEGVILCFDCQEECPARCPLCEEPADYCQGHGVANSCDDRACAFWHQNGQSFPHTAACECACHV